jgi:hypothetical protein
VVLPTFGAGRRHLHRAADPRAALAQHVPRRRFFGTLQSVELGRRAPRPVKHVAVLAARAALVARRHPRLVVRREVPSTRDASLRPVRSAARPRLWLLASARPFLGV